MKLLLGSLVLCAAFMLTCSMSFAAEKAKPINKKCPVEGGDVDPAVTTAYKGKTIGFCCDTCPPEFKKNPAKFMAIVDKELAADKKGDAKTGGEKKEAELNAKCPVSGDDADKTVTKTYKGRTIAFCCNDCVKDFDKNPEKYVKKLDEEKAKNKGGEKSAK
jgi:YHS domain-containing protein